MDEPIVSIQGLSHRYSKEWAVRKVNITLQNNGVIGLLGSNGAGKSTTMNILCGVINQTEGEVKVNGIDVRDEPVKAKQLLGFLPQKAPLYPELTVREYLTHCAYLRRIKKDAFARAITTAMDKCGITHYADRLIKNLSGGYQQRVGLAQAILHKPKLVVLDEPTNGLDPVQIIEVRKLITEIGKDRLVLLSTHILSEVQATCNHIIMIEKGKLVFQGSIEAFNNYIKPDALIAVFNTMPSPEELKVIEGVKEVAVLGAHKTRIQIDTDLPVHESVIAASVVHQWGLKEIYTEKVSLDKTFAKLSQNT